MLQAFIAKKLIDAAVKKIKSHKDLKELKKLRKYVEEPNDLDIQMKQVHKINSKLGKTIEQMEIDIAMLKKDSHPSQEYICCRKCGCKIAKTK
tara:strand:+ start:366 stop:644 length:279 start_codon:yes stop_codon:yes gene_type:complete